MEYIGIWSHSNWIFFNRALCSQVSFFIDNKRRCLQSDIAGNCCRGMFLFIFIFLVSNFWNFSALVVLVGVGFSNQLPLHILLSIIPLMPLLLVREGLVFVRLLVLLQRALALRVSPSYSPHAHILSLLRAVSMQLLEIWQRMTGAGTHTTL